MLKGLVGFDANGTLFDDTEQFFGALDDIFEAFGRPRRGRDWLGENFMVEDGEEWTSIYRDAGVPTDGLYDLYNRFYQARCREQPPRPAPGVAAGLRALHEEGYRLVLISTQEDSVTVPMLEAAGIRALFDELHGRTGDKDRVIDESRRAAGVSAEQTWFVGDQVSDGLLARRAGAGFIHRRGGVHTRAQVERALGGTVPSITDFRQLSSIVASRDVSAPGMA